MQRRTSCMTARRPAKTSRCADWSQACSSASSSSPIRCSVCFRTYSSSACTSDTPPCSISRASTLGSMRLPTLGRPMSDGPMLGSMVSTLGMPRSTPPPSAFARPPRTLFTSRRISSSSRFSCAAASADAWAASAEMWARRAASDSSAVPGRLLASANCEALCGVLPRLDGAALPPTLPPDPSSTRSTRWRSSSTSRFSARNSPAPAPAPGAADGDDGCGWPPACGWPETSKTCGWLVWVAEKLKSSPSSRSSRPFLSSKTLWMRRSSHFHLSLCGSCLISSMAGISPLPASRSSSLFCRWFIRSSVATTKPAMRGDIAPRPDCEPGRER
mmetsp:Transcript_16407/g.49385  ORF Transcript_16407/g.49385 Transcript_16407/m.49385 type:complete len:330 (-) Transcript_16407:506-1495(-)